MLPGLLAVFWTVLAAIVNIVVVVDGKVTCAVTGPPEVCSGDLVVSVLLIWIGGLALLGFIWTTLVVADLRDQGMV